MRRRRLQQLKHQAQSTATVVDLHADAHPQGQTLSQMLRGDEGDTELCQGSTKSGNRAAVG